MNIYLRVFSLCFVYCLFSFSLYARANTQRELAADRDKVYCDRQRTLDIYAGKDMYNVEKVYFSCIKAIEDKYDVFFPMHKSND